jgi:hypothetical protein
MAMTPSEMIEFHGERVVSLKQNGLEPALQRGDYHQVAVSVRQIFQNFLMQGLIGWRCELLSPVEPFRQAVQSVREGAAALSNLSDEANPTRDLPLDSASIVAVLVDQPPIPFDVSALIPERLLEGLLANALHGNWDEAAWNKGLEKLRKNKRAALAVETYATYAQLLHADEAATAKLVEHATQLFKKRAKNSYYSGSYESEGGGPDNEFTVDYRLAAVMKKIGYRGENLHRWRW